MIKLLKYDWKRNSTLILSTLAVLIVVQAIVTIVGETKNWADDAVIALTVLSYFSAVMLLFIICFRTYDHNIKSFSRRLLPVHPLSGTGAVVLLSLLVMFAVAAIAAINALLYLSYKGEDISEIIKVLSLDMGTFVKLAALCIYLQISLVIAILASITVARSFSIKRSAWIGIVFFFAVMSIIGWLEHLLFESSEDTSSHVSDGAASLFNEVVQSILSDIKLGPTLLEITVTAGLLALITYLLNKKVEV